MSEKTAQVIESPPKEKNKGRYLGLVVAVGSLFLGLGSINTDNSRETKQVKQPKIELVNKVQAEQTVAKEQSSWQEKVVFVDISSSVETKQLTEQALESLDIQLVETDENSPEHTNLLLNDDNYAASFLFNQLFDQYANHGEVVTNAASLAGSQENKANSNQNEAIILPLQEAMINPVFSRDEYGNPVVGITIDEQRVIELLASVDQPILNLSFQTGEARVIAEVNKPVFPEYYRYTTNQGDLYHIRGDLSRHYDDVGNEVYSYNVRKTLELTKNNPGLLLSLPWWTAQEVAVLQEQGLISPDDYFDRTPNQYINITTNVDPEIRRDEQSTEVYVEQSEVIPFEEFLTKEQADEVTAVPQIVQQEASQLTVDIIEPYDPLISVYSTSTAQENFSRLLAIAEAYSAKAVFAAGGNYGSDVYEIRNQLEDQGITFPPNLFMTQAFFGSNNSLAGNDLYLFASDDIWSSSQASGYFSGKAGESFYDDFFDNDPLDDEDRDIILESLQDRGQSFTINIDNEEGYVPINVISTD